MADFASDPKVEDVLSSVRRLVSGEVPRRSGRPSVPAGDALVLTEAQRVAEKPRPKDAAPDRSLEDRIAELEAAVDRGAEEFEPDGSEDQSQHVPDRIVYTRPPREAEQSAMRRNTSRLSGITLIDTGPAQEDGSPDEERPAAFRRESAPRPPEPTADEAPMAEDVPTLPSARAELQAFSDPDDVVAGLEARFDRGGEPEETSLFREAGTDAPAESGTAAAAEGDAENVLGDDAETGEGGAPEDFDAALSRAIAASIAPPEAAGVGDAAQPGDELDQDEASAFVEPAAAAPAETAPEEAGPAAAASEAPAAAPRNVETTDRTEPEAEALAAASLDALGDEEALRLLVARLIREELQGALGERITRNVRKLVRRELLRILDSRDLV